MKIFTKHIDHKPIYEELLKNYSHIDFSLFCDYIPSYQDYSSLNIMILQEPRAYFQIGEWVIKNQEHFQLILTWDDKVLNNCSKAIYNTFGGSWLTPDQYENTKDKQFEIAHLSGKLQLSYGHSLRHEILSRQSEINIPKKFFHTFGDRDDISKAKVGKEEVFSTSMFNIAIENYSHRGYFTEKLLDCFLFKTIPIYWGCSNVKDYFDERGIIQFQNVDDLIYICNNLTEKDYHYKYIYAVENYQRSLNYTSFEQRVVDNIIEIFKYNNIL